ncbi:MAG: DUF3089 domain-containing protein [Caulobacteraceae bacterium]|nr:DUF3089 domain-containing protein [Caulobacteraceae bacterium]
MAPPKPRRWTRPWVLAAALLVVLLAGAAVIWRDDILRTALDPKEPFQTYDPPPAADYAERSGWLLMPPPDQVARPAAGAVDVFFIGPTTYDGGEHWNAPVDDRKAERLFRRVMAPNWAGPFVRVGRIFAPRYRQASLYTLLTLREDAREARRFAYGDIQAAFRAYIARYNPDRPFVLVGVEQGGSLAARLITQEIAANPDIRSRFVAAYLIETAALDDLGVPACRAPGEAGCAAAWMSARQGNIERGQRLLDRSLVWDGAGGLTHLKGRTPLCFNPLLGATTDAPASERLHKGAANATGLEWGARPAFLKRQVSAHCEHGILRVSRPKSDALRRDGAWADRAKMPGFNLFYADLEADAEARVAAWRAASTAAKTLRPPVE